MRTRLFRQYLYHRGLVAGVVIALLLLAFMCPVMLPALCSGSQQTCQHHTCWLLELGSIILVIAVFVWLLWVARFALPREYPLLLFRPPRPLFLNLIIF